MFRRTGRRRFRRRRTVDGLPPGVVGRAVALLAMLAEGVTRIGTSSTSALMAGARERLAAGTLVVPEPPATLDEATADSTY